MQHNAREFQETWGKIISGDLDFPPDCIESTSVDEGLFQHVLNAADMLPTLQYLSDCALSDDSLFECYCKVAELQNREEAEFNEFDYLQQRLTSTDPKVQEAAALLLINRSKSESSQARVISARMSVTEALADLFCNYEMKSLSSKTTLSRLLGVIMLDFDRNCSLISQKVLPCALRVLKTASLDPDANKYVGSSLGAVARILENNNILDIDYMPFFDPHQFCSFFPRMIRPLNWSVINGILALPREKLGDTNLASLFLQPRVLDALRLDFIRTSYDAYLCESILYMWYKLVKLEPSAVVSLIRLDFLGNTILNMISGCNSDLKIRRSIFAFLRGVPLLMDNMLDVLMQDTIEYFFNRGFFKNLAAAIKIPTHLDAMYFLPSKVEPVSRVIRCFEIATPPVRGSAAAVTFDNKPTAAATPSVEPLGITTATSERNMISGRPAWAYDPTYDQFITPVPIDNLEAFAAALGNMYIAAFFLELLTPTISYEALSHGEQWRWLIKPNPLCLIVLRHLLRDKSATKKALFAAAGLHELSRNARDFEPRPDDPGRSYYRDEQWSDV